MTAKPDIRVIGIGSHHSADMTGWLACEKLQANTSSTHIDFQLCRSPAQLPELVDNFKTVVILDAIISDEPLGHVITMRWPVQQKNDYLSLSSHGLNVIDTLQLAEALGQLPKHTYILGICVDNEQENTASVVNNALPLIQQELEIIQTDPAS